MVCGLEGRVRGCPGLVWMVLWLLLFCETGVSDGAKPFQGRVLQLHLRLCLHLLEADLFSL